jgi:hypothetical protein
MSETINKAAVADMRSVQYWKERVRVHMAEAKVDIQAERAAQRETAAAAKPTQVRPTMPKL